MNNQLINLQSGIRKLPAIDEFQASLKPPTSPLARSGGHDWEVNPPSNPGISNVSRQHMKGAEMLAQLTSQRVKQISALQETASEKMNTSCSQEVGLNSSDPLSHQESEKPVTSDPQQWINILQQVAKNIDCSLQELCQSIKMAPTPQVSSATNENSVAVGQFDQSKVVDNQLEDVEANGSARNPKEILDQASKAVGCSPEELGNYVRRLENSNYSQVDNNNVQFNESSVNKSNLVTTFAEKLEKIAQALGCSFDDLYNYLQNIEPESLTDEDFQIKYEEEFVKHFPKGSLKNSPTRRGSLSISPMKNGKVKKLFSDDKNKEIKIKKEKKEKKEKIKKDKKSLEENGKASPAKVDTIVHHLTNSGMLFLIDYFKAQHYPFVAIDILRAKQEELIFQDKSLLVQAAVSQNLKEVMVKIQELIKKIESPLNASMKYGAARNELMERLDWHNRILQTQYLAFQKLLDMQMVFEKAYKKREEMIPKAEKALPNYQDKASHFKNNHTALDNWQSKINTLGEDRLVLMQSLNELSPSFRVVKLDSQITDLLVKLLQTHQEQVNGYEKIVQYHEGAQKQLESIKDSRGKYQKANETIQKVIEAYKKLNEDLSSHPVPSKSTVDTVLSGVKETETLLEAFPTLYKQPSKETLMSWLVKFKEIQQDLEYAAQMMKELLKAHKAEWCGSKLDLSIFQGKVEGVEELISYMGDANCPIVEIQLSASMQKEEVLQLIAKQKEKESSQKPYFKLTNDNKQIHRERQVEFDNMLAIDKINNA